MSETMLTMFSYLPNVKIISIPNISQNLRLTVFLTLLL